MHRIHPLHPSAILLALALLFAAVPARAQEAARFAPAATALPAALQPEAPRSSLQPGIRGPLREGILIGAGVGCLVFAAVGLTVDNNVYGGPLENAAIGCVFGAAVGGAIGFVYAAGREVLRPR
jgi:hypothetical protein